MTTPMTDSVALTLLDLEGPVEQLQPFALKRAYRAAARRAHPDAGGSEDEFQRMTEAVSYLQGRINGDIPAMRRVINEQDEQSGGRRNPIWANNGREAPRKSWTRAHVDAADALRFDDILNDLREATALKPLIEFLDNGEILVTRIPSGGAVSFDMARGATVYDTDGNVLECEQQIAGAEYESRLKGFVDDLRRREASSHDAERHGS